MRLRNSNLQESVESKNRELAAATMATIKNNKFLQQIIDDLKSLKSINEINSVLVTIKGTLTKEMTGSFLKMPLIMLTKIF